MPVQSVRSLSLMILLVALTPPYLRRTVLIQGPPGLRYSHQNCPDCFDPTVTFAFRFAIPALTLSAGSVSALQPARTATSISTAAVLIFMFGISRWMNRLLCDGRWSHL